jgi:serine/threonine protein kinase
MPLSPSTKLGPYEIIASLGEGGMGEVYRARDSRLGRDVALKVLPPEVTSDAVRLERFDREARAIAALNHPHIVTIYSTEEIDGVRFITMELVEGQTLDTWLITAGRSLAKFFEVAVPIADALTAAHHKLITHRDLKPGNVMVSNDGRVKVLDFGLARIGDAESASTNLAATQAPITQQGTIVGTMPYMSPEQIEGGALDPRSDLFSLGVILYEMLSGERPFQGSSSASLMTAILRDPPAAISDKRADIPEALERLISRLLEKRPEDRVQTARDVFNELRHVQKAVDSGSARLAPSAPPAKSPDAPPKPKSGSVDEGIAVNVRPFSAGSDPIAHAVAEGLTSEIATNLARFPYVRVVAHGGRDRELLPRSDYAIAGDVRISGSAIRINARLIDTAAGVQSWAQNFDRDTATGTFEIVDDVAARVVATIADARGELFRAFAATHPRALGDADLTLRFIAYTRHFTVEEHADLRDEFEAAVAQDPRNARAWGFLSMLCSHEVTFGFNQRPDSIRRACDAANRAIALDSSSQSAWFALAEASFSDHDELAFRSAADRTIELNPLSTGLLATVGLFFTLLGEVPRGAALIRRSMELNPDQTGWYYVGLFLDAFVNGKADDAFTHAKRITLPQVPTAALFAIAAAGRFERPNEARLGVAAWAQTNGKPLDVESARQSLMRWLWEGPVLEELLEGIRKAIALATRGPVS